MPSPAAAPNLVNLLGQEAQLHENGEHTFIGSDLSVKALPNNTFELKIGNNSAVMLYRTKPENLASEKQDSVIVSANRFDVKRLLADFLSIESGVRNGEIDLSKAGFGVVDGVGKDTRPQLHVDLYRVAVDSEELRLALAALVKHLQVPGHARELGISFTDRVRETANSHKDLAQTLIFFLPTQSRVTAEAVIQACHGWSGSSPTTKLLESLLAQLGDLVPKDLYIQTLKLYREPLKAL